LTAFVESVVSGLDDPIDMDFARSFVADTSTERLVPELVDRLAGEVVKVPARVWKQMFTDLLVYDDDDEITRLDTPTLLVWGSADKLVDRDMQATLASRIRDAELVIYEGVGHTPRWEEPSRFARDVATFTQRSRSPRT
jgi:pimeloyl-ACP methyl ester carboxylesterase